MSSLLRERELPEYGPIPSLPVVIYISPRCSNDVEVQICDGKETFVQVGKPNHSLGDDDAHLFDPEFLLDAFDKVRKPSDAIAFLRHPIPWAPRRNEAFVAPDIQKVSWADFQKAQAFFTSLRADERALAFPGDEFTGDYWSVEERDGFPRRSPNVEKFVGGFRDVGADGRARPSLWFTPSCAIEMLYVLINVKKLQGVKFGRCEHHTCHSLFQFSYKNDKRFCSPKCQKRGEAARRRQKKKEQSDISHQAHEKTDRKNLHSGKTQRLA